MALSVAQWKKYRSLFAWLFAIFFIVFLVSSVSHFIHPAKSISPQVQPEIRFPGLRPEGPSREVRPENRKHESSAPNDSALSRVARRIGWTDLVNPLFGAAMTSLVGYLFTWRKERRQRQKDELDLEMKKLELEKLRIDLEHYKQESSRPPNMPNNGV